MKIKVVFFSSMQRGRNTDTGKFTREASFDGITWYLQSSWCHIAFTLLQIRTNWICTRIERDFFFFFWTSTTTKSEVYDDAKIKFELILFSMVVFRFFWTWHSPLYPNIIQWKFEKRSDSSLYFHCVFQFPCWQHSFTQGHGGTVSSDNIMQITCVSNNIVGKCPH